MTERLNFEAANGLWVTGQDGFVVFEEASKKRAFLLSNFDGRPAYTCIDLLNVDMPATFDGPVAIATRPYFSFELANASLGMLVIRGSEAFLTTIDRCGQPTEVKFAPFLANGDADGHYDYQWRLMRPDAVFHDDLVDDEILYDATSQQSWLNAWQSPFADDFEEEPEYDRV